MLSCVKKSKSFPNEEIWYKISAEVEIPSCQMSLYTWFAMKYDHRFYHQKIFISLRSNFRIITITYVGIWPIQNHLMMYSKVSQNFDKSNKKRVKGKNENRYFFKYIYLYILFLILVNKKNPIKLMNKWRCSI